MNTYGFANGTAYQQYRLRVSANAGSVDLFQIAEVQLFEGSGQCMPEADTAFCTRFEKNCGSVSDSDNCGTARAVSACGACTSPDTCGGTGTANVCGTNTSERTEGGSSTATGSACAAVEGVSQLYDNVMTSGTYSKWCVLSAPSATVPISTMYDVVATSAFIVTRYTLTTGNDVPGRDPKDWMFQGCQGTCNAASDAGWVTLDTQTGQFANAARYQTNSFTFSNSTAYQQYRLRVTQNNGTEDRFQLAELQMF